MSRCRACNAIMKKIDYTPSLECQIEEEVCISCRQEILKHEDDAVVVEDENMERLILAIPDLHLGLSVEEVDEALRNDIWVEYRNCKFEDE